MTDFTNSSKLGKLFFVLLIIGNFILASFTLSQLASWFVMPVTLVQAMGMNVIWTFYTMRGPRFVKEILVKTDLYNRLITSYVMSIVALLIGFVLSIFL